MTGKLIKQIEEELHSIRQREGNINWDSRALAVERTTLLWILQLIKEAKKEIYKEFSVLDVMHKSTLEVYEELYKNGLAGPSVKQVLVLLEWFGE